MHTARWARWMGGVALAVSATRGAAQEPVRTLRQALAVARTGAYANRIADGHTDERSALALASLRGILPSVTVEAAAVRSTDPLAAFGTLLQQRAVTAAAFDPASLNRPAPITDVGAALVLEQPLVNVDAWIARGAAQHGAAAARYSGQWTRSGTDVDVVRAWAGVIVAMRQVGTLDSAVQTARAHQRRAESLHREGEATRSDALLASVRADRAALDLATARAGLANARQQFGLILGTPADTGAAMVADLPAATLLTSLGEAVLADSISGQRADLLASEAAAQGAQADLRRSTAQLLPRANAFGRLDWHDPTTPFGGTNSWTVGVMMRWTPFTGASEIADRRAASARRSVAAAEAAAATATAQVETARAERALRLALTRLATATRAIAQASEAHRIVARKYEGGLASVVELFDAATAETAARLDESASRGEVMTAAAALRRARGLDLEPLLALED